MRQRPLPPPPPAPQSSSQSPPTSSSQYVPGVTHESVWQTEKNSFGVYCIYPTKPSLIPDDEVTLNSICSGTNFAISQTSKRHKASTLSSNDCSLLAKSDLTLSFCDRDTFMRFRGGYVGNIETHKRTGPLAMNSQDGAHPDNENNDVENTDVDLDHDALILSDEENGKEEGDKRVDENANTPGPEDDLANEKDGKNWEEEKLLDVAGASDR